MLSSAKGHIVEPGEGTSYHVLGDRVRIMLGAEHSGGKFALATIDCSPGGGPPPHVHRNEDEVFYVLDGEMEFLLDDQIVPAPVGTLIYAGRDRVHQFRNIGQGSAKMLTWVMPTTFESFIREIGVPCEGNAPPPLPTASDIERVLGACPRYDIEIRPQHQATQRGRAPLTRALWTLGTHVQILCTGAQSRGQLCAVAVTTDAGGGPPPHFHHNDDEIFYVLQGQFAFLVGDRNVRGGPGTVVHVPQGTVHNFRNIGQTTGRFISFHTPAGMEHFFEECGTPVDEGSTAPAVPVDVPKVLQLMRKHGMEVIA